MRLGGAASWALAVAVATSGCAGTLLGEPQAAPATSAAVDVAYRSDEVCFYGRVLDDELRPLPNASVTISGSRASTISNHEGNFRLCRLEAGNYTLVVFLPGYLLGVATIRTTDGNGTVQVTLRPIPDPYIDIRPFFVYHKLGHSTTNVSQASQCDPCAFNFHVPVMPTFILFEATWERTLKLPVLADSMFFELREGNPYPGRGQITAATMQHPIRAAVDNETLLQYPAIKGAKDRIPLSGSVWCASYPCQDQKINVWVSSFYDYPDLPTDYTALQS